MNQRSNIMLKNLRWNAMNIEYLKLTNYRQYVDEKITFDISENEKTFTIIEGANGAGKTNISNAMTWCLYGKEINLQKEKEGLPLISEFAIEEMSLNDTRNVEVEIQMRDEEKKKITFKRSLLFKKVGDGKVEKAKDYTFNQSNGSKFEMQRQIHNDIINVSNPSYVIQKLIPENIKEYFFFDGERLNEYFKEKSGENIKEAVSKISQIELLNKVIKHLDSMKSDFLKESKNLSSEAKNIREQLEIYQKSKGEEIEELNDRKAIKRNAEKNKKEISEKLKNYSIPNIRKLEEERIELEKDIKRFNDDIDELERDRNDFIIKTAPAIMIYSAILKSRELIDNRKEAGDLPPDYKKNFIEKLLDKGECICGTKFKEDEEKKKNIEHLLEECSEITNISEELIKENANLRSIIDDLKNFRNKQIKFGKEIGKRKDYSKEKSKKLKEISETIGDSDVEEIKRLEDKLQQYEKNIKELIEEIARKENGIELAEKNINKLEKQLDSELKKEKKSAELFQIKSFCDKSLNVVKNIKENIMDKTRKEIEERTKNQFFELIWKKETFKDVSIDKDYNISVIHQSGREGIGTLSAGETQVLALSFMAALNSISGFKVPIIIDTPLGRISKEPKENIAEKLPNYLKDKQVILLVTEEEYTPEVRRKLSSRVGNEYFIEIEERTKGNIVKVVPYGIKRSR